MSSCGILNHEGYHPLIILVKKRNNSNDMVMNHNTNRHIIYNVMLNAIKCRLSRDNSPYTNKNIFYQHYYLEKYICFLRRDLQHKYWNYQIIKLSIIKL